MLFHILKQDMHDYERIMNVLFDLGFATRDQLNGILQWDHALYKLSNELTKLRNKQRRDGIQLIDTFQLPAIGNHRSYVAYTLTKKGMNFIGGKRGINNERLKVANQGVYKHNRHRNKD